MIDKLRNISIILASQSPRRQLLMSQLGLNVTFTESEVSEDYPAGLAHDEVARYLAEKKADHFEHMLIGPEQVLVTADTIVSIDGDILGKPSGREEAFAMLQRLSGKKHVVWTGVCLRSLAKSTTFCSRTDVYFKNLSREEIEYYLDHYKPYDKAGSYGAQEWIGYIGITHIEGSYFNVMGLPVQQLYEELLKF